MIFSPKKPQAPFDFYLMSVHLGVCHGPVDAIRRLTARDKIFWEGYETGNTTITVVQDGLFGGFRKEGGLVGGIDVLLGGSSQVLTNQQASFLNLTPAQAPGYRSTTTLWFRKDFSIPPGIYDGRREGFYWGTQPVVPEIAVQVERIPRQLNATFAAIGPNPDANPAHIIYECLINDDWGRGVPPSAIDVSGFDQASEVLFNEGLGLSLIWSQQANIDAFIQEVLDHINATFFLDPRTGLLRLKLIRGDYDVDSLPEFGPDDVIVNSFQRESISETINELVVTWTNPENEQEETVSLQDLANITIQGSVVSDSANYYGIRNADLAMAICARDLRQRGYPLATVELSCSRRAWYLNPGDVFKLNYPEYGIETLILRITNINYGSAGDPTITISAVEDIFGLENSEFASPPGTEWVDPSVPPTPMNNVLITSLPYYLIANQISTPDLNTLSEDDAVAGIFASSDNADVIFYDLQAQRLDTANNLVFESIGERTQIGSARISTALSREAFSTIQFNNPEGGERIRQGQYLLFGTPETNQEICLVTSVSGINVTIARGLCDTVPRVWASNSRCFVFNFENSFSDDTPSLDGDEVAFRLFPTTSQGRIADVLVSTESATLSGRAFLPLCPSNCSVNGEGFGSVNVALTDDLNIEWSSRNFLDIPTTPQLWSDTSSSNPPGQQTRIQIFDSLNNQVFSQLTTGNYLVVDDSLLGPDSQLRVRFSSVIDGSPSLQFYEILVNRL
jgi:hypothetical protein